MIQISVRASSYLLTVGTKIIADPKKFRNTLVTPVPHIQSKNMNKHLDKIWTQNASKQGKFGSLGDIFLFMFLPCMWGLGSQEESPKMVPGIHFRKMTDLIAG